MKNDPIKDFRAVMILWLLCGVLLGSGFIVTFGIGKYIEGSMMATAALSLFFTSYKKVVALAVYLNKN